MTRWQDNDFAVCPVLFVPRGERYSAEYRKVLDATLQVYQGWVFKLVGATFNLLPTKVIRMPKTAAEYRATAPNFYYDSKEYVDSKPIYDASGARIEYCNWQRLYFLNCVGDVDGLGNMAGRLAWGCAPAPENPMEPYGPGTAAGFSSWSLELLRGNEQPAVAAGMEIVDGYGLRCDNKCMGAALHELLHCFALPHPTEAEHGPEAWGSIMAGWWYFGTTAGLLEHERKHLKANNFFR